MKNKTSLLKIALLIFAITMISSACKTNKKTTEAKAIQEEPSFQVCDVMVSFISIGEGIDGNAKQAFEKLNENFMATNKCKIYKEVYPAGREGEQDYCMSLVELGDDLKKAYIEKAEALAEDNKLVFVKTAAPNKHMD